MMVAKTACWAVVLLALQVAADLPAFSCNNTCTGCSESCQPDGSCIEATGCDTGYTSLYETFPENHISGYCAGGQTLCVLSTNPLLVAGGIAPWTNCGTTDAAGYCTSCSDSSCDSVAPPPPTPSGSGSPSGSSSGSATTTASATMTASMTPSMTASMTPSMTATMTASMTASMTATMTGTMTGTSSQTCTPSSTPTPSTSGTATKTSTASITATMTPSSTASPSTVASVSYQTVELLISFPVGNATFFASFLPASDFALSLAGLLGLSSSSGQPNAAAVTIADVIACTATGTYSCAVAPVYVLVDLGQLLLLSTQVTANIQTYFGQAATPADQSARTLAFATFTQQLNNATGAALVDASPSLVSVWTGKYPTNDSYQAGVGYGVWFGFLGLAVVIVGGLVGVWYCRRARAPATTEGKGGFGSSSV